jgi:hypothetical protein
MDVKRLRNLDLIDVNGDKIDMRVHLIEFIGQRV